mgnify:CR=1 FL=1
MPVHSLFQSTLSMRRATADIHRFFDKLDISIHALHEESDHAPFEQRGLAGISIHALHEESDVIIIVDSTDIAYFNPRSP